MSNGRTFRHMRREGNLWEEVISPWATRMGGTLEVWALPKGEVPEHLSEFYVELLDEVLANIEKCGSGAVGLAITDSNGLLRMTFSSDRRRGADFGPISPLLCKQVEDLGGRIKVGRSEAGITVSTVIPIPFSGDK